MCHQGGGDDSDVAGDVCEEQAVRVSVTYCLEGWLWLFFEGMVLI
jgi:hypothetical protein